MSESNSIIYDEPQDEDAKHTYLDSYFSVYVVWLCKWAYQITNKLILS